LKVAVDVDDQVRRAETLSAEDLNVAGGTERDDRVVGPDLASRVVDRRGERPADSAWINREEARPGGRLDDDDVDGDGGGIRRDSALADQSKGSTVTDGERWSSERTNGISRIDEPARRERVKARRANRRDADRRAA